MTSVTKAYIAAAVLSLAGHGFVLGLMAFSPLEKRSNAESSQPIMVHLADPSEQQVEKTADGLHHSTEPQVLSNRSIVHLAEEFWKESISLADPPPGWRRYILKLREQIDGEWRYLDDILCEKPPCISAVGFSITPDGRCIDARILRSAGQVAMDRESLRTVQSAAPYEHLPKDSNLTSLNVVAEFTYGESDQSLHGQ